MFILVSFFTACSLQRGQELEVKPEAVQGVKPSVSPETAKEEAIPIVKVGKIKENPQAYLGKLIMIEGEYRGWRGEAQNPLITRSDWAVKDETGTIYVTGKPACYLDPYKDVGRMVVITGTLLLKDQIPYVKVKEIQVIDGG
jgi:hypothetical protein